MIEVISVVIAGLSTIAALLAAKEANRATQTTQEIAKDSKAVAEAQLFQQALLEYASPEMDVALRSLVNWKASTGTQFAKLFGERLVAQDQDAHEVNQARRRVKYFYVKAWRLNRCGALSDEMMKEIGSFSGINVFYDIAVPLELEINSKSWVKRAAEDLKKLCPPFSEEILTVPVLK